MVFRLPGNQSQERLYELCQRDLEKRRRYAKFIQHVTEYVPQHATDLVATEENNVKVLYADTPCGSAEITQIGKFKQQVVDNGRIVFVTCNMQELSMDFLSSLMNIAGVVDDSFPLERGVLREDSEFASVSLTSFISYLHSFIPPLFTEGTYGCHVPEMSSLPITTHERLGEGTSGVVYSICIDDGCFSFPSTGDTIAKIGQSRRFAMKFIANQEDATREMAFLQALRKT
jgi:hypothetical protein